MSLGVMEPYFTEVLRLREVGQYESHQMTGDRNHAPLHQSSSLCSLWNAQKAQESQKLSS